MVAVAALVLGVLAVPAQAASRPGTPGSVEATAGVGHYTVSWKAAAAHGAAISGYQVADRHHGSSWSAWTNHNLGGSARSARITGTAGSLHQVKVRARNKTGWGSWSAVKSVRIDAAPAAPPSVTATAGDGQVTLAWGTPAANGSALTGFWVYSRPASVSSTPWSSLSLGASTRSHVFTGLVNTDPYQFYVTAANAAGTSPASSIVSATPTAGTPPDTTPPPVPTGLGATAGDGEVLLSWTAVTATDLAGYRVYQGPSSSGPWTDLTAAGPQTATAKTVTGLIDGTTYFFTVASQDTSSNISAKATAVSVTPAAVTPPDTTPPGPVTDVHTTTVTTSALTLAWTDPTDADFTGVMIRRATGTTAPATASDGTLVTDTDATTTTFTDTGLTPGASYSYALFAHDGVPNYAEPATIAVTTAACTYAAIVHESGTITTDTTWSPACAGVYILDSTVTIPSGVTLTVDAGAIVKAANGAGLDVDGTLAVEGTAADPVTFTSIADDSAGGDTTNSSGLMKMSDYFALVRDSDNKILGPAGKEYIPRRTSRRLTSSRSSLTPATC